jgi:hypothetical protein
MGARTKQSMKAYQEKVRMGTGWTLQDDKSSTSYGLKERCLVRRRLVPSHDEKLNSDQADLIC